MNTRVSSGDLPPLALIAGPTASGKSALAMALAQRTRATIINADSMQVYRDLRIVTARPTESDEARVSHRLFGYIDGAEACSAARWAEDAKRAIAVAHGEGRTPILVGGTGLYIRTLLDGIAPVPEIDPAIRRAVRALLPLEAYGALCSEDPVAASRLAANDKSRVARALEVVRSTGTALSEWQAARSGGIGAAVRLDATLLLPPREPLFHRCDSRFEIMFELGRGEVERLAARDLPPSLPVMRAIGVREIQTHLRGEPGALAAGKLATRQYAKRQFTWFRNQAPVDWHSIFETLDNSITRNIVTKLCKTRLTP